MPMDTVMGTVTGIMRKTRIKMQYSEKLIELKFNACEQLNCESQNFESDKK